MWTGFKAEMVEVAKLNNSVGILAFHRPSPRRIHLREYEYMGDKPTSLLGHCLQHRAEKPGLFSS